MMTMTDEAFNAVYSNICTGKCFNLCDSCDYSVCKEYDLLLADMIEHDGYGNYYVVQCPCFEKNSY